MHGKLRGVIAAIITPVSRTFEPDAGRLIDRAHNLLANGCDGLNLLGTTGEATSFSLSQRRSVMEAVSRSGLPMDRLMVGTGAAALRDAVELNRTAADLGFAGALILPPFYYKPITDDGVTCYLDAIAIATESRKLPLFLYNFPALSGTAYTPALTKTLVTQFGERIAGIKDSSGDLDYARLVGAISPTLKVFPSNEGVLLRARAGEFAGCISATANLNSADCASAFNDGDGAALFRAITIREIFQGMPLVPSIKGLLAELENDDALGIMVPPLHPISTDERRAILRQYLAVSHG
jgi:4-hydroxy-tetrahydrodipicolinate synthase